MRLKVALERMGVRTELALAWMAPDRIRRRFNVCVMRTVLKLHGIACYPLESGSLPRQTIMCSRTCGGPVSDCSVLREALCAYTACAAEKLRRQRSRAHLLHVFLMTNPFQSEKLQYANTHCGLFPCPCRVRFICLHCS
ncbi:MAG TPA: hypothetical protein P5540_05760 [Candidatus Hydrogenedentes bacterium]|nr:hypothetical protein [Candidatus Hydrogenedentota bacterium]HRT64315.1 hypothetical protein [Candidatus Hydrogenedentota bacterium]